MWLKSVLLIVSFFFCLYFKAVKVQRRHISYQREFHHQFNKHLHHLHQVQFYHHLEKLLVEITTEQVSFINFIRSKWKILHLFVYSATFSIMNVFSFFLWYSFSSFFSFYWNAKKKCFFWRDTKSCFITYITVVSTKAFTSRSFLFFGSKKKSSVQIRLFSYTLHMYIIILET